MVPDHVRHNHASLRHWFFENPRPRFLGNRNYELTALKRNGDSFYMDAALFSLDTDQGMLAINLIRDISVQKEQHDKNSIDAFMDPLTELPNRRYFDENFRRNIAKTRRHDQKIALLFMDLDKFKPINDTLGHDIGDCLLQQFAKTS